MTQSGSLTKPGSLIQSGCLIQTASLIPPTVQLREDPLQSRGSDLPIIAVSAASGLARLKTRADFLRVAAGRRRAARPGLVLQAALCLPGNSGGKIVRVGFTASRKVGNAVVRNRAKRRLRAAACEVLGRDGRKGTDYVLIARAGTGKRRYTELVDDLKAALRQVDRPIGRQGERQANRQGGEEV